MFKPLAVAERPPARRSSVTPRRWSRCVLGLIVAGLLGCMPAMAEEIPDLYSVSVAVESQSAGELKRAGRDALAELFVRVSGKEAVLADDAIEAAIRRADSFTQQYSYQHRTTEDGERQLELVLEFEPKLVDDALRQAEQPLWPTNRPTILVWLGVEDRDGRRLVSAETDPDIIAAVNRHATRRGLAIRLPFMDLQDMVSLSPGDIWQQNTGRLREASERYDADTRLMGRLNHLSNGNWLGRWTFRFNGRRLAFSHEADNVDELVAAGFDRVAETLAQSYAIAPVEIAEGGILLRLTGVNNFVDYARAIEYLEGVAAIHHANVISLEGDELIVRLIADGQLPQLRQAFALDKRLQSQSADVYQGPYPVAMDYRWPTTAEPAEVEAPATTDTSEAIDTTRFDAMDDLDDD